MIRSRLHRWQAGEFREGGSPIKEPPCGKLPIPFPYLAGFLLMVPENPTDFPLVLLEMFAQVVYRAPRCTTSCVSPECNGEKPWRDVIWKFAVVISTSLNLWKLFYWHVISFHIHTCNNTECTALTIRAVIHEQNTKLMCTIWAFESMQKQGSCRFWDVPFHQDTHKKHVNMSSCADIYMCSCRCIYTYISPGAPNKHF